MVKYSVNWQISIRREIKDPRIHPMTSVVAVEVAPDLKTCKAWISVLGNEQAQQDTIAGLKSAEGFIRRNWHIRSISVIRRKSVLCWISPLNMVSACQN